MVGRGPLGDGDTALSDHDDRHTGSGRHRRHALYPAVPGAPARDGDPRRDDRPAAARVGRLYCVRVSGAPLRREDALADRVPLSDLSGTLGRGHHGGSGGRPQCGLRDPSPVGGGPHRRPHGDLHDDRRGSSRRVGRREADGPDRHRARGDHDRAHHSDARESRRSPQDRRGNRPAESVRLLVRPERAVHVLVGRDRRDVPDAVVLRGPTRARCSAISRPNPSVRRRARCS